MNLSFRNPLVALGLAGTIALGIAGVALAQETPTPDSETPTAESAELRPWGEFVGLAAVIKASGLDRQVFADGFDEGKTVAEILTENGLDPDAIKAEILANVEEGLDSLMDSTPEFPLLPHAPAIHFMVGELDDVAGILGMTEDELKEALRSGDTLAEIAEANGVDPQTVIDTLVADAEAKLAEAVENDRLTQEEADEIAANLDERITNFVNEGGRPHPGPFRHIRGFLPRGDEGAFVPGA